MKASSRATVVLAASVALAAILTPACKKQAGSRCSGKTSTCKNKETALACRGELYEEVACRGPLGCKRFEDHANCDTSTSMLGAPCMGNDDEYACTPDKKRALVCKGGTYALFLECRGEGGCAVDGHKVDCDTSLAALSDPCRTSGALACAIDGSMVLVCKEGHFTTQKMCRGQEGCTLRDGATTCDDTVAIENDVCMMPGQVACSPDAKHQMVCQNGRFIRSFECKRGCTVLSRPGRPIQCK